MSKPVFRHANLTERRHPAYSDIAVLPDGRIAVLFERGNSRAIDIAILPALE